MVFLHSLHFDFDLPLRIPRCLGIWGVEWRVEWREGAGVCGIEVVERVGRIGDNLLIGLLGFIGLFNFWFEC